MIKQNKRRRPVERLTPVKMIQAAIDRPSSINVEPTAIRIHPTAGGGGVAFGLLNTPETNAAPIPRYNRGSMEKIAQNPP